jgi:hypothetical protein
MHHLWGGEKPYFTVADDGTLVLHNVPVPPRSTTERVLPFWQRAFGWSALPRAGVEANGLVGRLAG